MASGLNYCSKMFLHSRLSEAVGLSQNDNLKVYAFLFVGEGCERPQSISLRYVYVYIYTHIRA